MALCLFGSVSKIELFTNTEGITTTKSSNKFVSFLIALAGYPFSVLTAYFGIYLLSYHYDIHIIVGISILFLFMLLLWIRNRYGIIWTILFIILNAGIICWNKTNLIHYTAYFYIMIILAQSIFSVFELVFLAIKTPKSAGDATVLQKITHIPAFFWAFLIFLLTAWVVWLIFPYFCKLKNEIIFWT
jgi:hypothetical protein